MSILEVCVTCAPYQDEEAAADEGELSGSDADNELEESLGDSYNGVVGLVKRVENVGEFKPADGDVMPEITSSGSEFDHDKLDEEGLLMRMSHLVVTPRTR